MDWQYSQRSRTERLIAVGRAALACIGLVAVWLDPSEPRRWAVAAYGLLIAYTVFAGAAAVVVFRHRSPSRWLAPLSLGADLVVATLVMSFTEGATSPFFAYFVFAMVGATLRWQWQGTLWTGVTATALFLAIGYSSARLGDPDFQLGRFIIRGTYLPVVGILLGYVGAYQSRLRRDLTRLAAWRPEGRGDTEETLRHGLEHVADALGARRCALVWEEAEEPWVNLAVWSRHGFTRDKEAPGSFQPLVDAGLAGADWLTADATRPDAELLVRRGGEVSRRTGPSLHRDLAKRLDAASIVALSFSAAPGEGLLLALDRRRLTADDLTLGEVLRQQFVHQLDQVYAARQQREAAVTHERVRLARDLHDGVLQSLAAAGLKLQAARASAQASPEAEAKLAEVQEILTESQKELRAIARGLGPTGFAGARAEVDLAAEAADLGRRAEAEWGLSVDLAAEGDLAAVPGRTAHEACRLLHEALVNAARHGKASRAEVRLRREGDVLALSVVDDGAGFPFRGALDLAELRGSYQGPRTLVDRVDALGGGLRVESAATGARVEIELPWNVEGA